MKKQLSLSMTGYVDKGKKTRREVFLAAMDRAIRAIHQQPCRTRLTHEQGQTKSLRLLPKPPVRTSLLPHLQLPRDHGQLANRGYNPLVAIQMAFSGQLYAEGGE